MAFCASLLIDLFTQLTSTYVCKTIIKSVHKYYNKKNINIYKYVYSFV